MDADKLIIANQRAISQLLKSERGARTLKHLRDMIESSEFDDLDVYNRDAVRTIIDAALQHGCARGVNMINSYFS